MLDPKEFYRGFQVNFFDYKALRLKEELENIDLMETKICNSIVGYNKEDHKRSIKIDIRLNYFQAIETVFELIFAFKAPGQKIIDDGELLIALSKKKDHYKEIRRFSEGSGGLEFLDKIVRLSNGKDVSLLHYIFFMGMDETYHSLVPVTLQATKYCLKILADEIADRREYNNLKHGLRNYRALKHVLIRDQATQKDLMNVDLSDSLTFLDLNEKTGEAEFVTKIFDTNRDILMTMLCGYIINNVFAIRRVRVLNLKEDAPIMFFDKEMVESCCKKNIMFNNFRFKG